TSAPSRCLSSLPSRSATSRTISFSSIPPGPSVPESCPPCPASTTMRPIFKPSARTIERSPIAVGAAAWITGGSGFTVLLLLADFFEDGVDGGGNAGWGLLRLSSSFGCGWGDVPETDWTTGAVVGCFVAFTRFGWRSSEARSLRVDPAPFSSSAVDVAGEGCGRDSGVVVAIVVVCSRDFCCDAPDCGAAVPACLVPNCGCSFAICEGAGGGPGLLPCTSIISRHGFGSRNAEYS